MHLFFGALLSQRHVKLNTSELFLENGRPGDVREEGAEPSRTRAIQTFVWIPFRVVTDASRYVSNDSLHTVISM